MVMKVLKFGMPVVLIGFVVWLVFGPAIGVGYSPEQPVPYSHALHAGNKMIPDPANPGKMRKGLNIDCQYCHTGVAVSKKAGIPSMNICMNCHNSIKRFEEPVKKFAEDYTKRKKGIEWIRVHNMPDHVRFAHAPHIRVLLKKGQPTKSACVKCHGKVEDMEVVEQVKSLNMGFCVNCHRDYSKKHLKDSIGNKIDPKISCATCHF